jgi:hypothetical protein
VGDVGAAAGGEFQHVEQVEEADLVVGAAADVVGAALVGVEVFDDVDEQCGHVVDVEDVAGLGAVAVDGDLLTVEERRRNQVTQPASGLPSCPGPYTVEGRRMTEGRP